MTHKLSEEEIELLEKFGMHSCSALSSILSDLYTYDEIFGDWKIGELIEAIHNEIDELNKEEKESQ